MLERDGFRIVLDLGNATLPRLLRHLGSSVGDGVDAVVITHRHPDHAIDLHGLFRARSFGRHGAAAIPLYAPRDVLDLVVHLENGDETGVRKVFDWHSLPSDAYDVGPFRLQSWDLPHFVPDAGVRLTAPGLVVAYTGDTGPDPALADLGRDADLYVMEASDRDQQPGTPPPPPGRALQLTAREAGHAAAAAGARRLLLMHFWPGNDREASRRDAAAEFDGEILVAEEGDVIALP
jgi:ribonuclease BN (tRNA processing enzyme)